MKAKISSRPVFDPLSLKIKEAILHDRVVFDSQTETDRECEAAWDVVEEYSG